MSRISTLLFVFSMIFVGSIIWAQGNENVLGPHIEWFGAGEPSVNVNGETRTIQINLTNPRDCVTVYTSPANRDYSYLIQTPNGKFLAERPHSEGFQATFCYTLVGNSKVVKVHVLLGKVYFRGLAGESMELKAVQHLRIVALSSGKMVAQEDKIGDSGKTAVTKDGDVYYEEGYGRYPSVHPYYGTPDWAQPGVVPQPVPQPVPVPQPKTEPVPVPVPQPIPVPVPQPEKPKTITLKPGEIVVPEKKIDIPEPPKTDESVKAIQISGSQASDKEINKYYGKEESKETTVVDKDKKDEKKPAVEPFVLDHSKEEKVRVDLWFGVKTARLKGSLRLDDENAYGTTLHFRESLDVEPASGINGGFDAYFKNAHVGFESSQVHMSGDVVVPTGGYRVGPLTFGAGSALETDLHYTWYRGTLGYTAYLKRNFGVGFDIYGEFFHFRHKIHDNASSATIKIESFIPTFGLHVDWAPSDRFLVTLGTHAGYIDLKHHESWKANLNTQIRFFPCQYGYIFVKAEWETGEDYYDHGKVHINADTYSVWSAALGLGVRF